MDAVEDEGSLVGNGFPESLLAAEAEAEGGGVGSHWEFVLGC